MVELARRLGTLDAVVLGLGSMLGAGVFVIFAPATAVAGGSGVLVALAIAALIAFCNAYSSARLAVRFPRSGGTYVYGREQLGPFTGFLAGWAFVVGKSASCAAMALAIGAYATPRYPHLVAVAAVLILTGVNLLGVTKTARVTGWLVAVTLTVLAIAVVAGLSGGHGVHVTFDLNLRPSDVLTSAGLLFFAFAGYARVATLGEEVRDPQRTIPRAIPLALGIVLAVYVVVCCTLLIVLGPRRLAVSAAPLVELTDQPVLRAVIRAGAVIAVVGVLLALLAGVARTTLAMAREGDLPRALAQIAPRHQVPQRAQLLIGLAVAGVVTVLDVRGAIGFSAFTVLIYYAVTNAAALTLRDGGQLVAGVGLIGCAILAFTLPSISVAAGTLVLVVGAVGYAVRSMLKPSSPSA